MREGGGFGWGGVEKWGENADNFNWTAIKKRKRKKKVQTLSAFNAVV